MRSFVLRHGIIVGVAIALIGSALYFIISTLTADPLKDLVITTVEEGVVEQIVSVSGLTKSRNTANLAFPTTGIVSAIPVKEGDVVTAGTVLASLGSTKEMANLTQAEAEVDIARAALNNLLAGTRTEAKAVTNTTVESAKAEVERVTKLQDTTVENARRALYSNNLVARSDNNNEASPAPIITGTYRCNTAGTYTLKVYRSNAPSGYSLNISGLEYGTFPVGINQPVAFGACGLFAQFSDNETYQNTTWTITVPNDASDNYITLKNNLIAAEATRDSSIASAKEALSLALNKQTLENAAPVSADVIAARARVTKAEASLTELTANLADRSIIAPFNGTITNIDIIQGETATQNVPVITLLATDAFEVVARVPEIDITKIEIGQPVRLTFDAKRDEMRNGKVSFIAPLPVEIDGVAYFEVKIALEEIPTWLRGGLNTDIDIITDQSEITTKVPTRYVTKTETGYEIKTLIGNNVSSTTVFVTFTGNDGYMAIDGITSGTTIVAP